MYNLLPIVEIALCMFPMNSSESRIFWLIKRLTVTLTDEWVALSYQKISEYTDMPRKAAIRGVNSLLSKKVIEKRSGGEYSVNEYKINFDYKLWDWKYASKEENVHIIGMLKNEIYERPAFKFTRGEGKHKKEEDSENGKSK